MTLLKRDCGSVYYNVIGKPDAPPLIMLRGLGRSIRHWLGFEALLAEHFKVITVELRGVGSCTAKMGHLVTLFDLADDVVAVLDDLQIKKSHILGISLGGMVALACGIRHEQRFKSLVAINTSIAGLRTHRITLAAIGAVVKGMLRGGGHIHTSLVEVLVGPDCSAERKQALAAEFLKIAKEDGFHNATIFKQLIAASRFWVRVQLSKVKLPVLVIYGTADRFVPTVNSQRIAALLPNATLQAIANGGHELPNDKPAELEILVRDWTLKHCG